MMQASWIRCAIVAQQVERAGEAADEASQMAGLGSPDGIAKIIRFLLSDDAEYVCGAVFTR